MTYKQVTMSTGRNRKYGKEKSEMKSGSSIDSSDRRNYKAKDTHNFQSTERQQEI